MGWIGVAGAVLAWFIKVLLLFVGVVFLLMPGYAFYFRLIGIALLGISILMFRTTRSRLLRERGIRIPTAVVALLLVGSLVLFGAVIPTSSDLEVSNERAELTDETLSFSMTVTNAADGPVTNTSVAFYVNASEETLATKTLQGEDFARGESRSFEVELLSLSELDQSGRAAVGTGEYRIEVVFDESTTGTTYTPASITPGISLEHGTVGLAYGGA